MNRILTWFLIALLLALSGPVQALSMASARGFEKSLYGRSTPCSDKYAYCGGDPINSSDPSGLDRRSDDDLGYQDESRHNLPPPPPPPQPMTPAEIADAWEGTLQGQGVDVVFLRKGFPMTIGRVATGIPRLGGISSAKMKTTFRAGVVRANRTNGRSWEQTGFKERVESAYPASQGYEVQFRGKGIGIQTPWGVRIPDASVKMNGQLVRLFEGKSGNAVRDFWQQAKDAWIEQEYGAKTVILRP